jgi:hypothetical protein
MAEYTKKERAELRRLTGEVYEWELGRELQVLDQSFQKWREGKMLSSDLSDEIHKFHQHAARGVWSMYQTIHPEMAVARGLAMGALSAEAISPGLCEKLAAQLQQYQDGNEDAV